MEILLVTDGSPQAKKAERAALRIAKLNNIGMGVLFVVNIMNAHSAHERNKSIKHGERVLNEMAAECKKIGVEMEKILEIGQTSSIILRVAKKLKVHTIVMGSEDKKRLRILSGSVTGKVVRNAECTVLVAR